MKVGDIVELKVTKISGYACWGVAEGKIGFSHCVNWSVEKPVPLSCYPVVGETIRARVFRLASEEGELPADVSCEGTIKVDFACSPAHVDETIWKQYVSKKSAS